MRHVISTIAPDQTLGSFRTSSLVGPAAPTQKVELTCLPPLADPDELHAESCRGTMGKWYRGPRCNPMNPNWLATARSGWSRPLPVGDCGYHSREPSPAHWSTWPVSTSATCFRPAGSGEQTLANRCRSSGDRHATITPQCGFSGRIKFQVIPPVRKLGIIDPEAGFHSGRRGPVDLWP